MVKGDNAGGKAKVEDNDQLAVDMFVNITQAMPAYPIEDLIHKDMGWIKAVAESLARINDPNGKKEKLKRVPTEEEILARQQSIISEILDHE